MIRLGGLLAVFAVMCAGCGGSTVTTTTTATSASPPPGRYTARDPSVKTKVEDAITSRVTQSEASAGDGSSFDPSTTTSCIAVNVTQLSCTVETRTGEQSWTAIVDQDTGQFQAQQL